ncbi:hypothetical protein A9986_09665 [Solibacillus silvestris]|nr:reverse transcriptase family protein [Solibacillus silvestris]OBW57005.1 hypothetical protein A9986_09665 [Solibacillus silvestris]
MLETILNNINLGNIDKENKNILIENSKYLYSKGLPIFLDERHVSLVFNIEGNIKSFVENSTSHHIIKKHNGDSRDVFVPSEHLKEIQNWLLVNILEKKMISNSTYSFVKGKSIIDHALNHIYLKDFWLVTFDVKDFFPSIRKDAIKNIFFELGYTSDISDTLSSFCSIKNNLVQGFPTSPIISNIYLNELDSVLQEFCQSHNITYSRYADDLAFSGEGEKIQKSLYDKLYQLVVNTLAIYELKLNKNKIKIYDYNHPKKLTGIMLTTNGIRVPLKIKKKILKEIYYCEKYGVEDHLKKTGRLELANYKGYIYGIAGFIRMVEPETGIQLFRRLDNIYWG